MEFSDGYYTACMHAIVAVMLLVSYMINKNNIDRMMPR